MKIKNIEITAVFLNSHKTKNGGYTKKQAEALGVPYPFKKGWKNSIIGKQITLEKAKLFSESNVPIHLKAKKNKYKEEPNLDISMEYEIVNARFDFDKLSDKQFCYIEGMLNRAPYNFDASLLIDISKTHAGELISALKNDVIVIFKLNGEVIINIDELRAYQNERRNPKNEVTIGRWITLYQKIIDVYGEVYIESTINKLELITNKNKY